ncbi:hypothetical protein Mpe_B0391 (plasmid) [Methylibium petroleiphilum PM1]|uniref:VWFA domain-containing protein n=2 Tax=Methylibium TaxID=316612 RepID=A2SNM7_METPP|nr:hypothetical protein Mpe_B0391 [Methylibium petroleiphilum PM1]
MQQGAKTVSMRHLYLYTHLLLDEAGRQGRKVRLEWANIETAAIGPDPKNPAGLLMKLPHMASVGTEGDATLLRALVSHEVLCHGHHTDFSVMPDKGIGGVLENVLEDPRGELLALARYPGSKKVIREGIEVLVDRGVFAGPKADEQLHPAEILTSWLVTELRSELLGQSCLEAFSRDYRKLAIQTFGSRLTAAVKSEALKATAAPTTADVQVHSRKILELLKMAKENPPPQQQPQSGQSGQPDKADAGQGAGNSSDPSQGGNPGDKPGKADGAPQPGKKGRAGKGDQPGDQPGDPAKGGFEPNQGDLAKAIEQVLKASKEDAGTYGKGLEDHLVEGSEAMATGGGMSHTHEMGVASRPQRDSEENRTAMRAGARAITAALGLKIEELLESRALVHRRRSTEGRIRPGRVWRLVQGDTEIFQKRSLQEELDTCVMVLDDESGSMNEPFGDMRREDAASRVCVGAGEVLNNAEVPFALVGYNTSLHQYKGFDDSWAETLKDFGPHSASSTNTHLAVVWALRELINRKERRKILKVVTDGDPGDQTVLAAAIEEAKAFGVEVRFVLISSREEYKYRSMGVPYGVANDAPELANAVFASLEAAFA